MTARQGQFAARRRRAGLRCAKELERATEALRAYLHACNECADESASLSLQGKGVDGREKLIGDMAEYSTYLAAIYDGQPA